MALTYKLVGGQQAVDHCLTPRMLLVMAFVAYKVVVVGLGVSEVLVALCCWDMAVVPPTVSVCKVVLCLKTWHVILMCSSGQAFCQRERDNCAEKGEIPSCIAISLLEHSGIRRATNLAGALHWSLFQLAIELPSI